VVTAALAAVLGFATHRASVCTVRTVAELMTSRSAFMLASVGKSILWACAVTIPFFLISMRALPQTGAWQLSVMAALGGFVFGLGAAMNGGCVYSTMARMVDGEGGMLVTVVGFAFGIAGFVALADAGWLSRPAASLPRIGALIGWATALLLLALAIYEAERLWRTRPRDLRPGGLVLARPVRPATAALR